MDRFTENDWQVLEEQVGELVKQAQQPRPAPPPAPQRPIRYQMDPWIDRGRTGNWFDR